MPEKKQGQVILMSEQQMKTMPILAMRDVCVLPGMLVHLDVSREITKRAIEEAMAEDGSIFLTLQRDESIETPSFHDLYEIGVIAKIKQEVKEDEEPVAFLKVRNGYVPLYYREEKDKNE